MPDNTNELSKNKNDLVQMLDEALKTSRISPSLIFKEADIDSDGVIHLSELKSVLSRLGVNIDKLIL
jgi:hypothetical protein